MKNSFYYLVRYRVLCVILLAVIEFTACNTREKPFSRLSILEGTWISNAGDVQFMEKWTIQGDTLMAGEGYQLTASDTNLFETLSIALNGDDIWYVALVHDQNDDKPVSFRLTGVYDNEFVFENPEHDFPDKIIYRFKDPNQLFVTVSGKESGKSQALEFSFTRMK